VNEEQLSEALFWAAERDPGVTVISWQGVDGKGYFAADIKLRLPSGRRVEPDLILARGPALWLIEVKSAHSEALSDEAKLEALLEAVPAQALAEQIAARTGYTVVAATPVAAVAYHFDDVAARGVSACVEAVHHIDWHTAAPAVGASGLGIYLDSLIAPQIA
jgi:hypothetical protein